MKKICMVSSIGEDFDTRVVKIVRSTAKAGFKVDLICPWNVQEGMQEGIYYRPFPAPHNRLDRLYNYPKIWRMISDCNYDIYYFFNLDTLPLATFFKLLKRKIVVYDIRENYAEEMRIKTYIHPLLRPLIAQGVKWGEWICARIIKNLVVVVDSLEKTYGGRGFNVVKVRNFATMELEKGRKDDYDVRPDAIIFSGSQYISNGSLLFLEIAKKIHTRRADVKFYSVDRFGFHEDKVFKQRVLNTIKEYGLQDVVIMLPNVKSQEVMSYINLATIGISPNLNLQKQKMAIPTKIFEYMAGGIPVVASNHPYQIEFIEKNKAGLLADPDYPDQFVEKILYLLDHKQEAKKMGENGLNAFREKYCWEKEEEKLIQMFYRILRS
jgi:glycosyltransferase involved in cell wall biosynthesis